MNFSRLKFWDRVKARKVPVCYVTVESFLPGFYDNTRESKYRVVMN